MNKLEEARAALMEAAKAYKAAANEAANNCVSFRDKYRHYQEVETTMFAVEGILEGINDLSEEAELCNTECPQYRMGSCAFNFNHIRCPRYAERLNTTDKA